ncbi:MAG: 1,4-dihydroxy-2-naphthoate polyprenyltransferase [Gammaproteobacteria bacterium]|nr:1,4-dihydroxy-2-naphthoate polyprenyltransferase [Gammaproteobacteria bacterium]MBU1646482.1 1,4-dihydroxy-2-naphthoate polyprenyltransferase [Gammaproteobacteria bacterium]MBU1971025.1 1,4-dihydroxy-2-naphthoate polyprenyltransferase [Gammaproteobacteria bacterium]
MGVEGVALASPPSPPPRGLRLWLQAARPRTLPLAATPVLAGTALAWAEGATPAVGVALAALLAAMLIQVGTNLHNDAADHARGNDRADRLGPLRVTAAGWATAAQVHRAAFTAFGLAFLLGVYLAVGGGWPIVAIGLAALAAGAAYSGGPRPISHSCFGEVFVLLFFGFVAVGGSYYLQSGTLSVAALLAGAAIGGPAAAVLMVNNLRDLAADAAAGRRTLAAVLGEAGSRRAHALFMLLPFLLLPPLALVLPQRSGTWLALLALVPTIAVLRRMRVASGAALNGVLADTARAQFVFGALLAAGCLL